MYTNNQILVDVDILFFDYNTQLCTKFNPTNITISTF